MRRCAGGFTLVELITVIMVMGILAVGTVRFITDSSAGFASTLVRAALAGDARFTVERLARSFRDALPNSIRVNGGCIEFIPVLGATNYTTLPVAMSAASFKAVPFDPLPVLVGNERVAVFPVGNYGLGSPAEISPPVNLSPPDAGGEITVNLAASHRFPAESPTNRLFLIGEPESYCVDNDALWRYRNYGFSAAQPGIAALPAAIPGRALIARHMDTPAPFTVADATLTRHAVVGIDVALLQGDDRVRIEHLVQVRNVP